MNHIKCPSRSSWLRALLLILSRIIVVLLLVRLLKSLPQGPIRTLVNIGGWIGFSALMGVWSHFISVLKKETKFWKIQATSVVEIVDALKISFLSDLIAIGLGLFFFFVSIFTFKLNKEDSETFLGLIVLLTLVIWFFLIPLLYEKTLIKRNMKTQSKAKAKTKPKANKT